MKRGDYFVTVVPTHRPPREREHDGYKPAGMGGRVIRLGRYGGVTVRLASGEVTGLWQDNVRILGSDLENSPHC